MRILCKDAYELPTILVLSAVVCIVCSDAGLPRTAVVGVLGGGQLGRMMALAAVSDTPSRGTGSCMMSRSCACTTNELSRHNSNGGTLLQDSLPGCAAGAGKSRLAGSG
jgi:hypothetical protein